MMYHSITELIHAIRLQHDNMVRQLYQFCEINSASHHMQGLQKMRQLLITAFQPIADSITEQPLPDISLVTMEGTTNTLACGAALFIRKRPELTRRILLVGHMDTVYPAQDSFQSLQQCGPDKIVGPGVADMKGGLIVMLHALSAFENTPFANSLGWDVFINAEEEIGSPASANLLKTLAPTYQAGLVYEPAMTPEGNLAKNRKGSGKITIVVTGKAAHAGRAFSEGKNAIAHLAALIVAIHHLNNQRDGVTINMGRVAGGSAENVVAEKAVVTLDIRISHPKDEPWFREQLDKIIKEHCQSGFSIEVHGNFHRPVKRVNAGTTALFQRLQTIAKSLDISLDWQDSGGCCDGNNLAEFGLPVLDTLGVRGGKIHSHEEFILLDSLVERATMSALLLVDLAQGGLEQLNPPIVA